MELGIPAPRPHNAHSIHRGMAMDLEYRQMTLEDVAATFAVRTSTLENAITMERLESDYGITPKSLADAMGRDVKGWVCVHGEEVVGFSMGNASSAEVLVVAVRPEYEGQGIGETVLAQVRDWLFAAGHEQIWLMTTPDPRLRAYGFYQSLGWQTTGEMRGGDERLVLHNNAR